MSEQDMNSARGKREGAQTLNFSEPSRQQRSLPNKKKKKTKHWSCLVCMTKFWHSWQESVSPYSRCLMGDEMFTF
jgi:hypothetical protein